MRLVFIHGMSQEGKNADALRQSWEQSLLDAWQKAGLVKPAYTLDMPFYGDELERLTQAVRGATEGVTARGAGVPQTFSPLEQELIRALAAKQGITDADVRAELGQEIVARGPANWEWVQAMGRLLQHIPGVGPVALGFVRQVDSYLTRPHIQKAIDNIVRPSLEQGPCVVVAHSLGTIVSYRLLLSAVVAPQVSLYVTLGSPLGIEEVKRNLKVPKPLKVPDGVAAWLNGTDERDYVALISRLEAGTFCAGIENLSDIHNRREDAHLINDYLTDHRIAARIHAALG